MNPNTQKQSLGIVEDGELLILYVENMKCGGCAKTITDALAKLGLSNIEVTPEQSFIRIQNPNEQDIVKAALSKLKNLGYPLVNSAEGLERLTLKAKSFASCAIGKIGS